MFLTDIQVKAIDTYPFVLDSVTDPYKTQETSDKFVSKDPFMLKCYRDRCKTQDMCDKAVDTVLPALKVFPDWFVTKKKKKKKKKTIKRLDSVKTCCIL